MADLFTTFLKASRSARKRGQRSARSALTAMWLPAATPKRKPRKPAATVRITAKPLVKPALKVRSAASQPVRPMRPAPGSFVQGELTCPQGTLSYRFYTPKSPAGGADLRRMPLIVMLHGCSQSAADFAAGTDMNRLADELGFLVLYPQQSTSANMGRCWNWHDPANQKRGKGEAAVIAALTRHAIAMGRANPARVYVAGISAGGATAAIVGAAYPELFVAVGVHSGVALGNIGSLTAAMAAMRGRAGPGATGPLPKQLPTIVFHGDSDRVVHPSNAGGFLTNLERSRVGVLSCQARSGQSAGGRDYTRRIYRNQGGDALLEEWILHGGGHEWSGGRAAGSHTDPAGPDASREMARFFLARRRSPAARR